MKYLLDRLVRVETVVKSELGGYLGTATRYGRIIDINTDKPEPFLIEFVMENGMIIRDWFNGWHLDVIR